MGGAFSRRKNLVERIGPARRQSMPSNAGGNEDMPATPRARPETCPAVPSPAADALWAASAKHDKRASDSLVHWASGPPGVGTDELSGLISTREPVLVKDWLNLVGLPQYAGAMEAAGWDDTLSCSLMTEADLRDVGIEKVGHRRRLLQAIESLRSQTRSPTGMPRTAGLDGDTAEPLTTASYSTFAPGEDNRPSPVPTAWSESRSEAQSDAAPPVDRWKNDLLSRALLFSSMGVGRSGTAGSVDSVSENSGSSSGSQRGTDRSSAGAPGSKSTVPAKSQYQPEAMAFLASASVRQAKIAARGTTSNSVSGDSGLPPKTVGVTRSTNGWTEGSCSKEPARPWLRLARMSPDCNPPPNRRHQRTPLSALHAN